MEKLQLGVAGHGFELSAKLDVELHWVVIRKFIFLITTFVFIPVARPLSPDIMTIRSIIVPVL